MTRKHQVAQLKEKNLKLKQELAEMKEAMKTYENEKDEAEGAVMLAAFRGIEFSEALKIL